MLHFFGLVTDALQVAPVDADVEGFLRSGDDLVDALVEVGLDVVEHPGISGHDMFDRPDGLVVVDLRIDADPVLGEVDAVDLVREQGLPDVGSEVAHARDRPQLAAGLHRHAVLLGDRGAGLGDPVHEEVTFLELGEQRLPELGQHDEAGQHDERGGGEDRARTLDDGRQDGPIEALQPVHQRRLMVLDRRFAEEQQAQRGRDGERDRHGGEHGQPVRDRHGPEEGARHPAHEEDGQQHEGIDDGGMDDGVPHLERCVQDDARRAPGASLGAVLAQAPHDVLDVDDRVVDHDPDRDDESRERHRVERRPP